MGQLRSALRIVATFIYSFVCWALAMLINLIGLILPAKRFHLRCRSMSIWGYGIAWIWGMRIKVHGTRPEHPFMLVSNHVSYTDIVLLCAVCPSWFISKSEVAKWPGVGGLTRSTNTLFIDRNLMRDIPRMNKLIHDRLNSGESVSFFPEGTTSNGDNVLRLMPSLLQPAAETEQPVHVASIAYRTPEGSAPPSELVAWYGDAEFVPHVNVLLQIPRFEVDVHFDESPIQASDRKQLAAALHERMQQNLSHLQARHS